MTVVPEWMRPRRELEDTHRTLQSSRTRRIVKRRGFARRTLVAFARFFSEMLDNETIASRRGFLQLIDPRVKLLTLVGLIIVATLVRNITSLLILYSFCILLALISSVPVKRIAKIWLLIPLFTASIALPAMLNIVTDGKPLLVLAYFQNPHFGQANLAITDNGVYIASRLVLRTAVCVTLALLLAATTKPYMIFKGLRLLGIPKVFVMVLSMMHRYAGLSARVAEEIHLARLSRTIAPMGIRGDHNGIAAGIGTFFRRTRLLGNNIYLAMLSRGYIGEVHILEASPIRSSDWLYAGLAALIASFLLLLG